MPKAKTTPFETANLRRALDLEQAHPNTHVVYYNSQVHPEAEYPKTVFGFEVRDLWSIPHPPEKVLDLFEIVQVRHYHWLVLAHQGEDPDHAGNLIGVTSIDVVAPDAKSAFDIAKRLISDGKGYFIREVHTYENSCEEHSK